jgi:hypothetical protein
MGRDSSVGIAPHYGLEGPGIESRWGARVVRTCPDRPWGLSSPLYNVKLKLWESIPLCVDKFNVFVRLTI